ncbi:type II toxin-antitoxin system VapC family toxin [Micromonospora sp. LOL_015]|uniref:type II toxin-antitoxin system VapC family toxin n=1 Tax=Micromonospora sp. LOL_015 TaxID=3345416 RepID=UPI003A86B5A3
MRVRVPVGLQRVRHIQHRVGGQEAAERAKRAAQAAAKKAADKANTTSNTAVNASKKTGNPVQKQAQAKTNPKASTSSGGGGRTSAGGGGGGKATSKPGGNTGASTRSNGGTSGGGGAGRAGNGEVAVDTNAVTDALSGAKTAEVDAALAGRAPVVSPTAYRELIEGGHSIGAIDEWISARGGRMGAASTSKGVEALQAQLKAMWKGKAFRPMIAVDDAAVLHSALQDGLAIITNDKRFYKNIERLGYQSERY